MKLYEIIYKASNLNQKESKKLAKAISENIISEVMKGENVICPGLGKFYHIDTKEKKIKAFGKDITIPARRAIRFKGWKNTKEKL